MGQIHFRLPEATAGERELLGVSDTDVESIVNLLAAASDPAAEIALAERKHRLFDGLTRLVDADTWVWFVGNIEPGPEVGGFASNTLDGGWLNHQERSATLSAYRNPDFQALFRDLTHRAIERRMGFTHRLSDLASGIAWPETAGGMALASAGVGFFIWSVKPIDEKTFSSVGLHRRSGRPRFTPRDRRVVQVLFQNIDWLHLTEGTSPIEGLKSLTPRERQVMSLLLTGASRKEAAGQLDLSEHTVGDYVKAIYRKLGVSSRAELLSKFIPTMDELD
jgi:DNA-binding CsgD family transcriptional regulator